MSLPKTPFDPSCDWHILLGGQRLGPYSRPALCQLLETHPDGWEASVWRPGMLDWRPAQRVEALAQEAESSAHDVASASAPSDSALPRVWAQPPASLQGTASQNGLPQPPREVAVFMQTPAHSRRVPPEFAETTHDMPTFKPARSQPLRTLGFAMTIGGLIALSIALVVRRPRSAPEHLSAPAQVATQAAPLPSAQAAQPQPVKPAPAVPITPHRVKPANDERAETQHNVTSIRVRAHWAPVRAAPDPDGKVLCSLKRGSVVRSFGQRPGTKARWFAVHCDKGTPGWVHENFLASVR